MSTNDEHVASLQDLVHTLWRYRGRCGLTIVVLLLATAAYAIFVPPTWLASQAIIVRDDAATRIGANIAQRQEEQGEVKTTEETLQELALSHSVLKNALQRVGARTSGEAAGAWPTEEAISDFRSAVALAPPKGAEFGKTAIFYLKVKDRDRDRALRLTDAVYGELARQLGELQATVAQGTIAELKESLSLTTSNLDEATRRLTQIEEDVGIDLAALRMLHQMPSGDASVYHLLNASSEELRQARSAEAQETAMLAMLEQAEKNPRVLLAAPKELLDCHPGLARLIQGLSEARLRTIAEASRLTDEHSEMRVVHREESGVREGIREELATAIQGVSAAKALSAARSAAMERQVQELHERLGRLSRVRAEYSNLAAQVEQRRNLVEETQRNLAQARAACAAATTSSLLSRVDVADGGTTPVGPSRAMIALIGLAVSIVAGCGVVFLTAPLGHREESSLPPRHRGPLASAAPLADTGANYTDRRVWSHAQETVLSGQHDV